MVTPPKYKAICRDAQALLLAAIRGDGETLRAIVALHEGDSHAFAVLAGYLAALARNYLEALAEIEGFDAEAYMEQVLLEMAANA